MISSSAQAQNSSTITDPNGPVKPANGFIPVQDAAVLLETQIQNQDAIIANTPPNSPSINYMHAKIQLLDFIAEKLGAGMDIQTAIDTSYRELAGSIPMDVPGAPLNGTQLYNLYLEVIAMLSN